MDRYHVRDPHAAVRLAVPEHKEPSTEETGTKQRRNKVIQSGVTLFRVETFDLNVSDQIL